MLLWLSLKDLPAWLQAFAAIVALFISGLAAYWAERRRDKLRARSIAVATYPEILKLADAIDDIRRALAQLKKTPPEIVGQSVAYRVQMLTVPVPPMLERNVDNFYLLDEPAGPACLQLVNILLQYNSLVERNSNRVVSMNAQQWPEALKQLENRLDLISEVVSKCKAEVQPLHDAIKG